MENTNYFIVRGDRSGVFFGKIKSRNGREIEMTECRNLWYWDGANALSELAADGTKRPDNCKFTVELESVVILDAIQIFPCTEKAATSIKEVKRWTY